MRKYHRPAATLILIALSVSSHAEAFRAGIAGGAVGFGGGHSGPADPTSPLLYKLHYTFQNDVDLSLAVNQLMLGRVFKYRSGAFIIPAAGAVIGVAGSGLGVSTTFGYDFFCWGLCFYSEFQQQFGIGPKRTFMSGYSVRVGLDYSSK